MILVRLNDNLDEILLDDTVLKTIFTALQRTFLTFITFLSSKVVALLENF